MSLTDIDPASFVDLNGPEFGVLNEIQQEAVRGITEKLSEGHRRIFVSMPTQTGKTGVLWYVMSALQRSGCIDQGLISTPRTLLAEQIAGEAARFAPDFVDKGLIEKISPDGSMTGVISIAATPTAKRALRNGTFDAGKLAIGLDEGHTHLSDQEQALLSALPDAIQIAVTASPNYSKRKGLEQAGYVQAYALNLQQSVERGFSPPVRNILAAVSDLAGSLDNIALRGDDYEPEELDKVLRQEAFTQSVIEFVDKWRDPETGRSVKQGTGIIFCNSIDHARLVAQRMKNVFTPQECGGRIPCAAIWGDMPKRDKEALITAHQNGAIMALANADFLVHGYSNPLTNWILNAAPTRSAVTAEQRPGRALAKNPQEPDKKVIVVDLVIPAQRNHQLLYGDVVGGFVFENIFSGLASHRSDPAVSYPQPEEFQRLEILYQESDISDFIAERDLQAKLNSAPHMDVYIPAVRDAMLRRDMTSLQDLWKQVQTLKIKHGYEDKETHNPATFHSVRDLVRGTDSPFNEKWKEYTLSASLVAAALGQRPETMFGRVPDRAMRAFSCNAVFAPDHAYPIDYDWSGFDQDRASENPVISTDDPEYERALMSEGFDNKGRTARVPDYLSVADPFELVAGQQAATLLRNVLLRLNPREEAVLKMRFGFDHDQAETLAEIGQQLGIGAEGIRNIEAKALRRLSHPALGSKLRPIKEIEGRGEYTGVYPQWTDATSTQRTVLSTAEADEADRRAVLRLDPEV